MRRRAALAFGAAASLGAIAGLVRATGRPIVVWYTVEGAKAMRAIGERFTAETGVPVVVETPDDGPAKFQQAAGAGKGPDIYVYAHDPIGSWIGSGLLHAVTPGQALYDDIDPVAWRGFTSRGRLWGYPFAIDAVTLVVNKALVREPPKDFDEVFALDRELHKRGKRAILWDYTNNYFSWPLLAAHGGYAYGQRPDGSFDVRDVGVANEGALRGAKLIDRLIREGLMPPGSGYPEMEAAMSQQRVAMMINGPWSWVNLKRVGIDFTIAKIPAVAGRPARPYIGVRGLMINRATAQREAAVELIEHHVLTREGLRVIDRAEPIGAPASRGYFAELSSDPRVAGIMASARDGIPTPSIPEMGRFWATMKTSLTNLSEGRQTPEQALQGARRRMLAS